MRALNQAQVAKQRKQWLRLTIRCLLPCLYFSSFPLFYREPVRVGIRQPNVVQVPSGRLYVPQRNAMFFTEHVQLHVFLVSYAIGSFLFEDGKHDSSVSCCKKK
ncbi:hypothetical protein ABZP36_027861 [Zizania latifolia]